VQGALAHRIVLRATVETTSPRLVHYIVTSMLRPPK
jgi:hypothetical protein